MRQLDVVAGVLRDAEGRVLIAERLEDGPFRGMWEFPGGKIGAGESPESALQRELAEEIGIEAGSLEEFLYLEHEYPDRHVSIRFYRVVSWRNQPSGREGQRIRWLRPADLRAANLLPADEPVIDALLAADGAANARSLSAPGSA